MKRPIAALSAALDQSYADQASLYQQILKDSIDPAATAELLRRLEFNTIRRQNFQRQLNTALENQEKDFLTRFFR